MTAPPIDRPPRPGRAQRSAGPAAPAGRRRRLATSAVLGAALLLAVGAALTLGSYRLSPGQVLDSLIGRGTPATDFVLRGLRLPRVLAAVGAGAALGVSGSILQSLTRNPLATPDILGINVGAGAAVAIGMLDLGLTGPAVPVAALVGAGLAGGLLYLLSGRGGINGGRLVLIGIGVAAAGQALISFVLTSKPALETQRALFWLVGSLNDSDWAQVRTALVIAVLVVCSGPPCRRWLAGLELGDDAAAGLGVPVARARTVVLAVAVVLAALAVAVAGPLVFVALVAAPLARAMTGGRGYVHFSAAAVGALVVLLADNVGAHFLGDLPVPAGVLTAAVGAPYLLFLLTRKVPRS